MRNVGASALLLVLMVLMILTLAVVAFATLVRGNLLRAGDANREVEAKAMAHSGLAIGLHPLVTEKTPLLEEELGTDLGYRVRIVGEGGKLNINWLLTGEEPRKLDILKHWLERHELDFQERERLVDCLLDWVDGDNVKHLNGEEDEGDYLPPNKPFETIDEMEDVAGMEPLLKSPGWKDELTIYSQGALDHSAADENSLRLLPGMSEARITRFLQIRRGKDGVDGTIDDYAFKSLDPEIRNFLGFSIEQFKALSGLVTNKDQTMRIISEGHSGNSVRQVEVVARKTGGEKPPILFWKE